MGSESTARPRVLLIDDNPDVVRPLSRLLTMLGAAVTWSANPRQARALAESFQPDIVLLDIVMPEITGLELVAEVRAVAKTPRILALTGLADTTTQERCKRAGFDGFIAKPVELDVLKNLIATAANGLVESE